MHQPTLALAQTVPLKGNVQGNLERHTRLIGMAAEKKVQLLVFPELSLTGYEPELAEALAFTASDERLQPLQALAGIHQMTIVAGAPYLTAAGLHIAAFILFPDQTIKIYTKHFLHAGEEKWFIPGNLNPGLQAAQEKISLAICADMANPLHAAWAAAAGSTVYLASAFISEAGYSADALLLSGYARKHAMLVMMANFGGDSGGYTTGGRSAAWSEKGELIAQFDGLGEGLVMVSRQDDNSWATCCIKAEEWSASALTTN